MITHSLLSIIYQHLMDSIYVFARILSFFIFSPIFSEKVIFEKVKIGLALFLTLLLYPLLPSNHIAIFSLEGVVTLIMQLLIGMVLGSLLQFLFYSLRHAGEIISLQMGLSFSSFYDFSSGQNLSAISRLLNAIAVLIFLSIDAHLLLIEILIASFNSLPVSDGRLNIDGILYAFISSKIIFSAGFQLALPIIILLLCTSCGLGLLNRLTPQLSIFVVGFPLSLLLGMSALCYVLCAMPTFLERLGETVFEMAATLLQRFDTP